MKKVLFVVLVAFSAMSCDHKVDFNELLEDDFAAASLEYPDREVKLFEVQTVMSQTANLHPVVLVSSTIIQIGRDSVKRIDRIFSKGRIKEEYVTIKEDVWPGILEIRLDSVKITLNDALDILSQYDGVPRDHYMTFRKAYDPPYKLRYIFGSKDSYYLAVDALTGEVDSLECNEPLPY